VSEIFNVFVTTSDFTFFGIILNILHIEYVYHILEQNSIIKRSQNIQRRFSEPNQYFIQF